MSRTLISRLILAAFLTSISACSIAPRTIDVARLGPANQIQVYEGGKPVLERAVTAGSAEERAIMSWMRSHADGWRNTLVTYVPDKRIRGENFNLNFGKDRCVLNYRLNDKGDFHQVARLIGDHESIPDVFTHEQRLK